MRRLGKLLSSLLMGLALSSALLMAGCEGTESRSQVDDSVEELAGKKQVERMKEMQKELQHIQGQQNDRIKQLNQSQ